MTRMEEWRKITLSINDNTFFDLMRNYLGKIETPFNKQELIDRLTNFLSREDIQETVISLIGREDAELLSALSLGGGASETQLRHYFPHWSYLELLNRIRNLEERFLIYRLRGLFCITPLFESRLRESVISPSLLITTGEAEPRFDPLLWFNDPLMLALYSFLNREGNLIKTDGTVKKRGFEKLEQTFPTLFCGEEGIERFDLSLRILENLNLIRISEGSISLNHLKWKDLTEIEESERYCLYYGAALADNRARTESMARFISRLYSRYPRGKSVHPSSLPVFFILYCGCESGSKTDSLVKILKMLNVLVEEEKGLKLNGMLNLSGKESQSGEPSVVLQPNFEVTVKPHISLPEALEISGALELKQYDLFSRYGLTKLSFLRAFGRGLTPEVLLGRLEAMSGKDIPQNIKVSLGDWADDHRKVTLYRGTVMKVSEDKRSIIEKTGFLAPYILETLAEGIYLLDSDYERQWSEALSNLSITPREVVGKEQDRGREDRAVFIPNQISVEAPRNSAEWDAAPTPQDDRSRDIIDHLLKILAGSPIRGDERKELEARIKRKLIFHESQLNRGIIRPEISEAKGMNFQGKVRLVESALQSSSDRLELSYFLNGETATILIQPLELKKEQGERILSGMILPDEEPFSMRLSKVSRIRKIKSSLF